MARTGKGRRAGKGNNIKNNGSQHNTPVSNKKIAKKGSVKKNPHVVFATGIPPAASFPKDVAVPKGNPEEKVDDGRFSGFIFMCSQQTKPECFRHHVFGLPAGKIEVVRKIKPNTKLFLYDFDLKLLYGVYKAASDGQSGLEPAAFGGRFPSQVRFKIFRDCLPLPESELRRAIPENYEGGSKFKPELSGRQCKKLMDLFRAAPPSIGPPPHAQPPVMRERYGPPARLPPPEEVYAGPVRHARGPPPMEPHYAGAPPPSDVYYNEGHPPYLPENPVLSSQDPYGRHRAAPEMIQRERYGREDHRSFAEMEREHEQRAGGYYAAAAARSGPPSYAPPPPYAPAPSYAPPPYASASSYAPPPTSHAPGEVPSYFGAYEDPSRAAYQDPYRAAAVGRNGAAAGGHVPVSSRYAFAGPTPAYR